MNEYGTRYETKFPEVFHMASYHLVAFGAHGGDTKRGRHLIARALIELRRKFGRDSAKYWRKNLLFISGMFPIKQAA